MRWTWAVGLLIASLGGCKSSATTGQESKEESDFDFLRGHWGAEAYERLGKPVGPGLLRNTRVVIDGDELELIEAGDDGEIVTFQLDESTDPKHIDMRIAKGPQSGRLALGIYRLHGDTLRICWAAPGQPRPTAFTTMNDTAIASLTLRRLGRDE